MYFFLLFIVMSFVIANTEAKGKFITLGPLLAYLELVILTVTIPDALLLTGSVFRSQLVLTFSHCNRTSQTSQCAAPDISCYSADRGVHKTAISHQNITMDILRLGIGLEVCMGRA